MLASTPPAALPAAADDDKIVCKLNKNPDLGSNIRKRKKTCMRASEWKQLEILTERAKMEILNGKTRGPGQPAPAGAGRQ